MYSHLILFFLPAFGMTVMSAPAANGTDFLDHDYSVLESRAGGDVQLCGLNFRSDPGSGGVRNKVFKYNAIACEFEWLPVGSDHTGLQKEHTVDLQLVKTALEKSGFCTAFLAMVKTINDGGCDTVTAKDALQPLRDIANNADGMFFCDPVVNRDKSTVVGRVRTNHGAAQLTGLKEKEGLRQYFAEVRSTGDSMAARIDDGADAVLAALLKKGTESLEHLLRFQKTPEKKKEIQDQINDMSCALQLDQDNYRMMEDDDAVKPVTKYWNYVLASFD